MTTFRCSLAFFAVWLIVATAAPANAGAVTIDRIIREHKVCIATTEPADQLSAYWLDWRPYQINVMPLAELYVNLNRLDDGAFIIYVIDRSKARLIPEQEALLPCATSGIGAGEVLVYASKTGNKREKRRAARWDVLISAPNDKWLHYEMERLGRSGLLSRPLDERGAVIDRYSVKRLCIVSTEGKQLAEDWVKRQTVPGKDAIDWDFIPWQSWTPESGDGTDVLFLLNRDRMTERPEKCIESLPGDIKTWLADLAAADERALEKQIGDDKDGKTRTVAAVVAPCGRQLKTTLDRYASLAAIPESLARHKFTDLSAYTRLVMVARPADRSSDTQVKLLDDFAGKITSALGSSAIGFKCESRQDLKELIYESLRAGGGSLDSGSASEIRDKLGGDYALAVAELAAVDAGTSYVANDPQCATSPYPAFSEPRPREPSRPDPHARRYGFIGPKLYPQGENDPAYRERLHDWEEEELPRYEREVHRWERDRDDYEARRYNHDMEWVVSVDAVQTTKVTGNLRIYDLSSFTGSNTGAGRVIFSCPLSGSSSRRATCRSDRVIVRGEQTRPYTPAVPGPEAAVSDQSLISEAFQNACAEAARDVLGSAILPADRLTDLEARN